MELDTKTPDELLKMTREIKSKPFADWDHEL